MKLFSNAITNESKNIYIVTYKWNTMIQFLIDETIMIYKIILQDIVTENQDIPQNNTCFLVISVIIRSRGARRC